MILTVGMSPCVDVTVRLNKFALGKTNVAGEKIVTYAGKANNVALGVSRLRGVRYGVYVQRKRFVVRKGAG